MIMKKINVVILAVAAMVCMVSCEKDDNGNAKTFKATAERSKDGSKLSLSGSTLLWSALDSIRIYDNEGQNGNYILRSGAGTAEGAFIYSSGMEVGDGPYKAVYPARFYTGSSEVTLPSVQHTTDGSLHELPMYATSANEELSFFNICGVVRFRLTAASNVNLKSIAVTTNVATNGAATISGSGTSTAITTPNGTTTTTLICETAQNIASAHDFYMYLPAGSYSTFSILLTTSNRLTCTKNATSTITVERGMISTITLTGLTFEALPGVLPGEFSVASGRTVHFSQGNLQYICSAGTPYWKFADHQYDYLANTTTQYSDATNVDRDLFGWGTSGYHDGNDTYNTNYQPYSTSNATVNGTYNYYGYGPSTNMDDMDLTGTSASYDWCVYNAIQNGGNTPERWRTLTIFEWDYLLTGRANAASKVGYATVAGVHGIILLPDSFTDPMKNGGSGAFVPATQDWDANTYTAGDWPAMELMGAVFLPTTGLRNGSYSGWGYDSDGYYWSVTYDYDSPSANVKADALHFTSSTMTTNEGHARYHGYAVRAVRD